MFDGGEVIRKLALNVARYSGLAPLAKPFVGGIGAILMLHRVTATPEKPFGMNRHLNIAPDFLDAVIADMKACGYAFVSLDEAVERIRRGGVGGQFATITADDAYRDNLVEALPVLERHAAPLTIYVAPEMINGGADLWWDVIDDIVSVQDRLIAGNARTGDQGSGLFYALPEERSAPTPAQLSDARSRRRGPARRAARIGAVSRRRSGRAGAQHADGLERDSTDRCASAGDDRRAYGQALQSEAAAGSQWPGRKWSTSIGILKDELGEAPKHMAYPYGYASAVGCREVRLAKEAGYVSAVTTRHGVLRAEHAQHLHALPRISVNGRYQSVAHIRTMLSGITTPLANRGRMLVTV